MDLDKRLENVTVIGAAGKMGSGIAVLVGQEMAKLKLKNPDKTYKLNLVDSNEKGLGGLYGYIKSQLIKVAEKSIVNLRSLYESREDLVENKDIIDAFIEDSLQVMRFGNTLDMAKDSSIIFEAILEDEDIKIKILKQLNESASEGKNVLFFTNTSSIPIDVLDKKVGLDGRLIGYHFYNPPVVQRLVEVITSKNTSKEARDLAQELGKRLRKKLVPANDIAGFIGNGHFMRDGLHGIKEVEELESVHSLPGAIYMVNRVTQDFLIRPMGIFQLIDYVGIEVFQCILKVMNKHLKDPILHSKLIDTMVARKVLGGQNPDGSQKDGFLSYKRNKIVGVYDLNKYIAIEGKWKEDLDKQLGTLPEGWSPWKTLLLSSDKEKELEKYFKNLSKSKSLGSELAVNYLKRSKEIAEELVKSGVANSEEDINGVLTNGFYWLYGPINNYI